MLAEVIGAAGSILSFGMWLPQARRAWLTRHDPNAMRVLSVGTYLLVIGNATLWAWYAILTRAWWSGVPSLFSAPLAVFMLYLIWRARRHRTDPDTPTVAAGL